MAKWTRREFAAGGSLTVAGLAAPRPVTAAPAKRERHLLALPWPEEKIAGVLLSRDRWRPFPPAADRDAWQTVAGDARKALIAAGERQLGAEWPVLPASVFLEFRRNGNRSHYEQIRGKRRERLRQLVIAECLEGKDRFLDEALNGLWATCEETFWGLPAHLGMQKAGTGLPDLDEPIVDLFAAETASLVAWTGYLLGPRLDGASPLVGRRIREEIDRRILTPNLERIDFSWMGLDPRNPHEVNNWNPWINSNWLACALLSETDARRRVAAVRKILLSLDRFLDGYHDDGGCDEGPGYWGRAGASLFDCLELLRSATGGAADFYAQPLIGEIGRYIARAHIAGEWFLNFADAPARMVPPGDLVFRYGRRIGDPMMGAFGAWAASEERYDTESDSIGRQLAALFDLADLRAQTPAQALLGDAWLAGIQVMAARRKAGSAEGLYLAAKGGNNAESHNHNDVGNFVVYADGQPAIIDIGVETYTAKTFSSRRYEIWTMQSAYHNLPTIGGVMQKDGRQYAASEVAYRADARAAEFSLRIDHAYPPEAGLVSWRRALRLDRAANVIELKDSYELDRVAGEIALTLMTPCRPEPAAGELVLRSDAFRSGSVRVRFDAAVFEPVSEEIEIKDARLRSSWGEKLYRVRLTARRPPRRAEWAVHFLQQA